MTRILFITGTDTGVGKTVVTAALASRAASSGTVAVVKPAQTGVTAEEAGDLDEVRRLTGITDLHEGIRLLEPLAPTTAGRRQGLALPSVEAHAKTVDDLAAGRDLVLVEGAGGLLVGLDEDGNDLADLAAHLETEFAFVVVARAGLGTLNHAGLTVEALRARSLPVAGLVIGSWPAEPDLAEQCNLDDLPAATGVPVIGRVPAGAGALDQAAFTAAAPGWFSEAF
ncbi:dethiobiotin synthetase [Kribbella orskensis]|uniref:ATP-dependent dethiobiotin synthetase BioD n=1 Tax=Kribbella orskensis TaxID=2512216 RepID=A0ABY2BI72_9ACTN|nr:MULTISPECIES: dethiobiotin synthase [Kribbella]TCN38777.1 dethiobiotin synthetase [Kribbella sp. VKM Ac-2500]TCO20958.1 dethiobiotin synthetase [Kribbella orskensis]